MGLQEFRSVVECDTFCLKRRISIFDEQGNMRIEYCLCPAFKKARGARRATPRNPPVAYVD